MPTSEQPSPRPSSSKSNNGVVDTHVVRRLRRAHLEAFPIEALVLAGRGAAEHAPHGCEEAILAAVDVLAFALDGAIEGDVASLETLRKIREAAGASAYQRAERICGKYLAGEAIDLAQWEGARDLELLAMLERHVALGFQRLRVSRLSEIVASVRTGSRRLHARALAARLYALAKVQRKKGETGEQHERRILQAMADAEKARQKRQTRRRGRQA